jgi:alpha-D-xyloside xylohydrolase
MRRFLLSLLSTCVLSTMWPHGIKAQWIPPNPVNKFEKQADGVLFTMQTGVLKLQMCTDSIIHVIYAPKWPLPARKDYVVIKTQWAPVQWNVQSDEKSVTVSTARIKVAVDRKEGLLT